MGLNKNVISASQKYFLPYQQRWLNDNSKVKIWEKSRRIGATYVGIPVSKIPTPALS